MTTTQETYLHIIQELENQDNDKIMRHLAMLIKITPRGLRGVILDNVLEVGFLGILVG